MASNSPHSYRRGIQPWKSVFARLLTHLVLALKDLLALNDPRKTSYLAPLIQLGTQPGGVTVASLNYVGRGDLFLVVDPGFPRRVDAHGFQSPLIRGLRRGYDDGTRRLMRSKLLVYPEVASVALPKFARQGSTDCASGGSGGPGDGQPTVDDQALSRHVTRRR